MAWLPLDMLASPAFRALSRNAFAVLHRLLWEHVVHGATANGELVVSHAQFEAFGVNRNLVAKAVAELEAAGVVSVLRRGKIAGRNAPNLYRLTWLGGWGADGEKIPPSNEWKARTAGSVKAATERRKRAKEARRSAATPAPNVVAMPARNSDATPKTTGSSRVGKMPIKENQ